MRSAPLIPSLLSLSLLGVSACDGVHAAPSSTISGGTGTVKPPAVTQEQPCLDPSRAQPPISELCPPSRQVAHLPDLPECPVPAAGSGWVMDELFTNGSVPATMNNYCRYIWTSAGAPVLGNLPASVQAAAQPDCRVVAQSPLAGDLDDDFEQAFAGGTQPIPDVDTLMGSGAPVEIAVVDTAPFDTSAARADHGPTIAALVAKLASGCVPDLEARKCRRRVSTWLGLPQVVGVGADSQRGGYFGYQSELAQGIFAALAGWTNHDHKLIINLAVGWEPSLGDLDANGRAPTAAIGAVQHMIQLATCQGALVVAASGNQPAGSCVDEATGPGSWERLRGLDNKQCGQIGLTSGIALGSPADLHPYHPLLHSATPIDWSQQNLADFRPGSDSRLAALGFAGFAKLGATDFGPLSGSSVSTAVVSGIAALVWSYFPSLSADEVMHVIWESGATRTRDGQIVRAHSYLASQTSAPEQRVVTACGALVHACNTLVSASSSGTPTPTQCQAVTARCNDIQANPQPSPSTWWTGFEQAVTRLNADDRNDSPPPIWTSYECTSCGSKVSTLMPRSNAIPAQAMPDPWVLPQPEKPPCPMCQIKDDEIYLSIDPDYVGMTLSNVSVELSDRGGTTEMIHYGPMSLSPTQVQVITDPALLRIDRSQLPPVSAWVSMVFTDAAGRSITAGNQIPVGP